MEYRQTMKRFALPVFSLAILVAIGVGGYYLYKPYKGASAPLVATSAQGDPAAAALTSTPPALASSTPQTQAAPNGMREYANSTFHFSLLYPNDLQATEYKEQGGALTVTFEDPATSEGFEIYVTPFSATQITESRFKLDEPSGTFLQPTNVVIDGTQATMFFGYNSIMGDTREVWFIHGGFLYEVATYKALDSWLAQIMESWKFI